MVAYSYGFIYIIVVREFAERGEKVYKVGRTQDILERLKSYGRGSKLVFCTFCDFVVDTELEVLKEFDKNFAKTTRVGNEYFEGELNAMLTLIHSIMIKKSMFSPDLGGLYSEYATRDISKHQEPVVPVPVLLPVAIGGEGEQIEPQPKPKTRIDQDAAISTFIRQVRADVLNGLLVPSLELFDEFQLFVIDRDWTLRINHKSFCNRICHLFSAVSVSAKFDDETHLALDFQPSPRIVAPISSSRNKIIASAPIDAVIDHEYIFIRDVIILPCSPSMPGEKKVSFSVSVLFANFCEWLATTEIKNFKTNVRNFGGKLSCLLQGSKEMKGIEKDRLSSGMVYTFDIGVFAQEMEKMWIVPTSTYT